MEKKERRREDCMQTDQINSSKSGRQLLLQRALSHLPRWEANNSKMEERKALPQTSRPIHLMVSIAPTAISRRFPSPPQSPKHLLTLLSNSSDAISTSLKNVAVVARASLGGCMCLPVSAEKIVISQTLDCSLFCFVLVSWTIPTNAISLLTSPGKSS